MPVDANHARGPRAARFSSDGSKVIVSERQAAKVYVLDAATGAVVQTENEPAGPVEAFPLTAGRVLAYPDNAATARIWEIGTGRQLATVRVPHDGTARARDVSPDGRIAVIERSEDVVLLDTDTGQVTPTVRTRGRVYGGMTPDGSRLMMVDSGWAKLFAVPGGRILSSFRLPNGCLAAAVAPGGKIGAFVEYRRGIGHPNPDFQVTDLSSGQPVQALPGLYLSSSERMSHRFSPDGRFFLTTVECPNNGFPYQLILWDTTTWQPAAVLGDRGLLGSTEFSPDGRRVVATGMDNLVRVFDLPAPGALAPVVRRTTPPKPRDAGNGWEVVFRSAEPSIWKADVDRGPDTFALPMEAVPAAVRFLRLTNTGTGKAVIVGMTKDRLGKLSEQDGYGWNGANPYQYGGYHLGVYDPTWSNSKQGLISILHVHETLSDRWGWGFGHRTLIDDRQGYSWGGEPIDRTVFESAVKLGDLTADERMLLLKK
jgi:Tol biopolymer transport system component